MGDKGSMGIEMEVRDSMEMERRYVRCSLSVSYHTQRMYLIIRFVTAVASSP